MNSGLEATMESFEVIDHSDAHPVSNPNASASGHKSTRTWRPPFWHPYPVGKSYEENTKPWLRPEQLKLVFVGVNIVNVDTASISRDMTVKISQGLIQEIRKTSTSKGDTLEEGWVRIDAGGMYLCPGLIDCHVHILAGMGEDSSDVGQMSLPLALRGMLFNGFTTVRDVGGATRLHRQATEEWLTPGPRLFIGGPVLSQTGGHGDHNDREGRINSRFISSAHFGANDDMAILVDGVDACLKAARRLMMAGADHVKICTSGGVLSPTDKIDSSQFTVPEIKAVCDTVRMMGGTLVTSHCNTDAGARNAIEGGVGGIEHGGLLSDDTLRLMAKKGIHYTPTLIIQDYVVNGPLGQAISPFSLEKAKRIEKNTYTVIRRAYELGVNVTYGTDCFVPFQLAEFDLRARVLPGHVVLQQATCNAAKVVGMEGKLGIIKPGAYADLLLLAANPLEDIGIMNKPNEYLKAVVKDGRCVRSDVGGLEVEVYLEA